MPSTGSDWVIFWIAIALTVGVVYGVDWLFDKVKKKNDAEEE